MSTPIRIQSPSGLSAEFNPNGSLRRLDCGDVMINLFLGSEIEGGVANIYLRLCGAETVVVPLLGPRSPAAFGFDERGMFGEGRHGDVGFRVRFLAAESAPAWFWHVELENRGEEEISCDLVYAQDTGLAHYGAIRLNEYYVSHYIDHTPLRDPERGIAVASRQNQSMGGRFPWVVTGSLRRGAAFATDALQVFGLEARAGRTAPGLRGGLPGKRLQHEHSLVAVQDEPARLAPGQKARAGFFGYFLPDKPEPTGEADVMRIGEALSLPEAAAPEWPGTDRGGVRKPAASLFAACPLLEALPLEDTEIAELFPGERRHEERVDGGLWSFFYGPGAHVVLKAKELRVLRPHGQLLRTGGSLTPDEAALTSTAWMNGVFHSMVTQGHVSINRFLSACHTYLGLFRSHGQRVFAELGGSWHLLDVPSAFEMRPDRCRWVYKHAGGRIEAEAVAPAERHELRLSLRVAEGAAVRFLISHHVALNGDDGSGAAPARWEREGGGVFVRPAPDSDVGWRFPDGGFAIQPAAGVFEEAGGDGMLFDDGVPRGLPFVCFRTAPVREAGLVITGRLIEAATGVETGDAGFWETMRGPEITPPASGRLSDAAARLGEILPWYVQNALAHYLSPRGLEQYSGGGWGTRDVCQGAVELLLGLGRFEPVRDLLTRVFCQQNADGDWPQWFMFFDRERNIRPGDSHGDIVYWPLLALAQYLAAAGDAAFLDEPLPFFHPDGETAAERAPVWSHVERALVAIRRRVIPGTRLAAYGNGDWNDALQPARPELRERLCSSWTVTLNYQTLAALAEALDSIGRRQAAAELRSEARAVLEEFQGALIADGVIAGLVYFHEDGSREFLLHPSDDKTGLSFSLLPMIHAVINDMLTPDQAAAHLALIRERLTGPDGARLFDRPLKYRGGLQTLFQRAESASYFGREIGVMYTHAHLRYCEALARCGDAAAFFHALRQAVPVGIREVVPPAAPRQANCYYSSSDAVFADRYEAYKRYDELLRGEIPLEGGWRVYSSGPGIAVRLVMHCFLGVRVAMREACFDPVMPAELDGLRARVEICGRPVTIHYRIGARGCGVEAAELNGEALAFRREPNRYRPGAARVSTDELKARLACGENRLVIRTG